MIGNGTGKLHGKQVFVCKRNYAVFLPIEAVILEEDFDGNARKVAMEGTSQEGNNILMEQMCKEFLNFLSVFFVCVSCYIKTNNF